VIAEDILAARQNAISVVGVASAVGGYDPGGAHTVSLLGLNLTEGDTVIVLYGLCSSNESNPAFSISGYTSIGTAFADDSRQSTIQAGRKVMTASPDTSITLTQPTSWLTHGWGCLVFALRGVDASTPIDVSATTNTVTNDQDIIPADITPVTDGAMLIVAACAATIYSSGTYTTADTLYNFTETGAFDSLEGYLSAGVRPAQAAAFSPAEFVHSADDSVRTSHSATSITIALRPA